jgi:guanosine-3',5'-bis(diphosphate) 3'-pyrophosphohydrolase
MAIFPHENCRFYCVETILKKIVAFADAAHGDQRRKYADERYVEHPIRVMMTCQHYGYPLPVLAAAILHDVLEDTDVTQEQMKEFLITVMNETDINLTLSLVTELTDVYTKDKYPWMNRRQRKGKEADRLEKVSADAQTIKYGDIIDNARGIVEHGADFAPVFLKECTALLKKMEKGNKELHQKAIEVVAREMDQLKTQDLRS